MAVCMTINSRYSSREDYYCLSKKKRRKDSSSELWLREQDLFVQCIPLLIFVNKPNKLK